MAKHRERVAFESQLLSVTQLSLQTEVEAKLRAIKRLRQQIERLSEPSRVSRVDDARRLQEQIKSMQVRGGAGQSSSQVFRALADGTRRRILELLRESPLTSGQIADRFDSSWPTISRHLAVLRDAGLVITERNGQEILYELNTSVFQELVQHLIEWTRPSRRGPRPMAKRAKPRQQEA